MCSMHTLTDRERKRKMNKARGKDRYGKGRGREWSAHDTVKEIIRAKMREENRKKKVGNEKKARDSIYLSIYLSTHLYIYIYIYIYYIYVCVRVFMCAYGR